MPPLLLTLQICNAADLLPLIKILLTNFPFRHPCRGKRSPPANP